MLRELPGTAPSSIFLTPSSTGSSHLRSPELPQTDPTTARHARSPASVEPLQAERCPSGLAGIALKVARPPCRTAVGQARPVCSPRRPITSLQGTRVPRGACARVICPPARMQTGACRRRVMPAIAVTDLARLRDALLFDNPPSEGRTRRAQAHVHPASLQLSAAIRLKATGVLSCHPRPSAGEPRPVSVPDANGRSNPSIADGLVEPDAGRGYDGDAAARQARRS